MGRRKKRAEAPLSLFSFQDIMACLTGILIMVSLLLAFDGLSDAMQAVPGKAAPHADDAAQGARAVELNQRIAILRRTIDERKGGIDVSKQEADLLDDRVRQLAQQAERTKERVAELDAELARLRSEDAKVGSERRALEERLSRARQSRQAQAMRDRVRFRPGQQYSKAPIFLETTANALILGELDASRTPLFLAKLTGPDAQQRLIGALGAHTPDNSYIVFVVHQDAIARFEALRDGLFRRGYEVGWQLWDGSSGGFLEGAASVPASGGASAPAASPGPAPAVPSAPAAPAPAAPPVPGGAP